MSTVSIVWITFNLWFGALHMPVEVSPSTAAVIESHRLRVEAEELRRLAHRYVERRQRASIHHQNRGRPEL